MQIPGEGEHLPGPRPPLPVPWGSRGACGGPVSHTNTQQMGCGGHSCGPLPPAGPQPLRDSGGSRCRDMRLPLSPSRLDGPHFSCLVSGGPGRQQGWGRPQSPLGPPRLQPQPRHQLPLAQALGPLSQSGEVFAPLTSCLFLLSLPHSADLFTPSFLLFAFLSVFKFLTCNTTDAECATPNTHSTVRNDTSLTALKSTGFGHLSLSAPDPPPT